ncbi:MAG: RagB/SusD family nutrient uptake outer membrane protein [Bacteroidota bacterium]|uniref:RagB/SusD family nutrient uptake outer membrane protein n=1 Tax=Leeuwenhoekiella palythoae TaxID=573501 RepID=UPI000ED8F6F9|nr:RagB/SusD family nutrient uptake outer membrane protein [Leeuwenhoekiella palythoae]MEC7782130.1 RagB/SusD family nutrient uptake outer membrane protein [Bacteroidota bacterium]UBZ11680.1 RagB/SusD family nutrient uptake outer membrane protein [Leeuwenhoekiella palythoae]HCQ77225.1 RagB/SusD family nutrient uptake outer membrane protein [Leeuwenhoekiella sp.]|tara:strand:+ start:1699 stop:3324 length:1626 start_codon:yes stop_codon:yes gene_type:complete
MKMNYIKKIALLIPTLLLIACHDDLDQTPIDPDSFTETNVFANADEAKGALAKLYASLALTGQQGPAGQADITGIDEGTSQYSRLLFSLNELTTDNAVVGWGDPGLPNLHAMNWGAGNDFTTGMYYRLAQEVSFTNSFIENAQLLNDNAEVEAYIAEARFLRAFAYFNLMDLFGDVPLVTVVSTDLPEQSTRSEIFNFVEGELLEIQDQLKESGANEYGRVDRVAAWALLSKLYLNAQVWTGTERYTDAITYAEMAINSSYSINTTDTNGNGSAYDELFLADNNSNGAQNEFIFALNFDGNNSRTYGGTTFLVHAAIGGSMDAFNFGVNGGWSGLRTTKALVNKFDASVTEIDADGNPTAWADSRAMFYTDGQSFEINTIANQFTDGYAVTKFTNIDSNGAAGSDTGGDFVDTDLPIIRLAEIYLTYAEAVLRGGAGGDVNTAAGYINELRARAYGNTSGNITSSALTLDFILDERARELYWEGQRRTDLIRFNDFTTGNYLWPFKGGSRSGTAVDEFRNLFPLPSNIILINTNLTQNPGY